MKKLWNSIRPLWDYLDYLHLCWARRELHPLNPDMPDIVLRINQLEAKGVKL